MIVDNNRAMNLCYAEAVRKGELPKGKMEVEITIGASGSVTQVNIDSPGFQDSAMADCTIRRVKNWKFPKFNGSPVPVSFPLIF